MSVATLSTNEPLLSGRSWDDVHGNDEHADQIMSMLHQPWSELFAMDRPEVEAFQLAAVRNRIDELAPKLSILANQIEDTGVTRLNSLDDAVPLLFSHQIYKSYPMSIIERGRYDMLTEWLGSLTTVDLSGVDASSCAGVDDWFSLLERETRLRPFHTSGTSGKISILPRTSLEADLVGLHLLKKYEAFGEEPGANVGFEHTRLPVIWPTPRQGRYFAQRMFAFMSEHASPTPQDAHPGSDDRLSADMVLLSGRIRIAQAKGTLSDLTLTEEQRQGLRRHLEEIATRPSRMTEFLRQSAEKFRGQRVLLFGQSRMFVEVAQEAARRGVYGVFARDSLLQTAGGGKGVVLPPDWAAQVKRFAGVNWTYSAYGMTETTGTMGLCRDGHYHIPPFFVPYLLDPNSGAPLPRHGRQTGRFAFIDLLPNSYWAGLITGDEVTIEWDRQCPCGRKGAHIHDSVTRYSEAVSGDDKITCAATIDNTDTDFQKLIAL